MHHRIADQHNLDHIIGGKTGLFSRTGNQFLQSFFDGAGPREHDPALRWPFHVLRGYQERAELAMGNAIALREALTPLSRALLDGIAVAKSAGDASAGAPDAALPPRTAAAGEPAPAPAPAPASSLAPATTPLEVMVTKAEVASWPTMPHAKQRKRKPVNTAHMQSFSGLYSIRKDCLLQLPTHTDC